METKPVIISAADAYAVSTLTLPVVPGGPDYDYVAERRTLATNPSGLSGAPGRFVGL